MERPCDHCDHPDISLLRVVLIGEIIRADDATLYTLAEVCETIGLLRLSDDDDESIPPQSSQCAKHHLRRIK